MKPIKPEYQLWRKRIEGQIRHAMNEHPEWFNLPDAETKVHAIGSIAKRIIGEIVAGTTSGNNNRGCVSLDAPMVDVNRATVRAVYVLGGGTLTATQQQWVE
jgi:hypothetical protein